MSFLRVMSALPRSATAEPGRSEHVGAWGPYRGPHVQVVAVVGSQHEVACLWCQGCGGVTRLSRRGASVRGGGGPLGSALSIDAGARPARNPTLLLAMAA